MSQQCNENGVYCPTGTLPVEPCPAGNYCTMGKKFVCAAGRYCPVGQGNNHGNMSGIFCPPGTYNSLTGQSSPSACLKCPAGKKCNANFGTSVPETCRPGEYCPEGTANPTSCPPGSYCPVDANSQPLGTMLDCPAGFMCGGSTSVPANCGSGSYCPANSSKRTQCPGGTYCPGNNSAAPIQCPAGSFCPLGSYFDTQCPPATYCPEGSSKAINCTEDGTYCPPRSASPINCEPGWYCDNLRTQMGRHQCPSGRYCPGKSSYSLQCPAGYDCRDSQISTLTGRECPAGFYCTAGTGELHHNGTRGPNYDPVECPRGYMCPTGSGAPNICPKGTYTKGNVNTGRKSTQCLPCPAGKYCPNEGNYLYNDPSLGPNTTSMPTCPTGKYCPAGTINPIECTKKTWCDEGSTAPTTCARCPNISYSWSNPSCTTSGITACSKATAATTCCDVVDHLKNDPKCPPDFVKNSVCTRTDLKKSLRCIRQPCK